MHLIMENHTQKMLLSKNDTSLEAPLKKCLKACRTSWKCRGRGKPEPEVDSHAHIRFFMGILSDGGASGGGFDDYFHDAYVLCFFYAYF